MKLEEIKALVAAAKLPEEMVTARTLPETCDVFECDLRGIGLPVARFFDPNAPAKALLFANLPAILKTLISDLERAEEDVAQWRAIAEEKCDEAAVNEIPNMGTALSLQDIFTPAGGV